jgi:DNA replication protein DnaC
MTSARTKTMATPQDDPLGEAIRRLGLLRMREIYPQVLARAATENLSMKETLAILVEEETRARFERLVARRVKEARIPVPKTLDSFDWKHPRRIKRDQVLALFDLGFVKDTRNVCFVGRSGVGKTHLATALALEACRQGHRVLFSTAVNVVNQLQAAQSDGTFLRRLRTYLSPAVLVIDELGYLPIDRHGANLLFQVISGRYERGSVLLTTNRPFKEWASIFNDATVADAVINRLVHHSEVVVIEGRSYRLPPGDEPAAD